MNKFNKIKIRDWRANAAKHRNSAGPMLDKRKEASRNACRNWDEEVETELKSTDELYDEQTRLLNLQPGHYSFDEWLDEYLLTLDEKVCERIAEILEEEIND